MSPWITFSTLSASLAWHRPSACRCLRCCKPPPCNFCRRPYKRWVRCAGLTLTYLLIFCFPLRVHVSICKCGRKETNLSLAWKVCLLLYLRWPLSGIFMVYRLIVGNNCTKLLGESFGALCSREITKAFFRYFVEGYLPLYAVVYWRLHHCCHVNFPASIIV